MAEQKTASIQQRRTIAVLSVHGVGDQKPFETVRRMGDLLQALSVVPPGSRPPELDKKPPVCADPGPESPRYYPFHEQKLRVNVNPVVVREGGPAEDEKTPRRTTLGPFNAFVSAQLEKTEAQWSKPAAVRAERPARKYDLFVEFMKRQLACYGGDKPEDTYETLRLEGSRSADGGEKFDVHIYELYWADLSRLKAGIFSIFTELYQLLFHLSSLGVNAVNAAALDHPEESSWRWLRRFQGWSCTALTVPIPIFNLFMLGTCAVLMGLLAMHGLSTDLQSGILAGCFAATITAAAGGLLWRGMSSKKSISATDWMCTLAAALVVGLGVPYLIWQFLGMPAVQTLHICESVLFALISGGLVFLLLRAYDIRRPGVLKWSLGLSPLLLAGPISFYWLNAQLEKFHLVSTVPQFWIREFEMLYGAVTFTWLLFFIFGLGTFIFGWLALLGEEGDKKDLAIRSRWTGRLMLSLPSLLFLLVSVMLWGLLAKAVEKFIPTDPYYSLLPGIHATCAKELVTAFLSGPVGIVLPVALLCAGIAAIPAVWGMFPVVCAEVFPPPAYKALNSPASVRLGRWLTLSYRAALLCSGVMIYLLMTFILPAGAILDAAGHTYWKSAFGYLGVVSGAAFGWLFLARGSLKKLALGFRPALDLLLDVDNWFREHPLNANPKARICGRYISLLRYICNWKDDVNPEGYEKLVIIAHSQGTVISSDLLRFLHSPSDQSSADKGQPLYYRDIDPQLARLGSQPGGQGLPVSLFTMGCPLRQLYGLRFPYLYRWARHSNQYPMSAWKFPDLDAPPLPAPDPADLGVDLWVNAFRSGDYVGRNLWRTDDCDYLWNTAPCGSPVSHAIEGNSTDGRSRLEFCIGSGAHTHYWDDTAPMIARELDRLIADI
jgi:hypothetical protein